MSVVVGLAHEGKVYLGGDSAATDVNLTVTYTVPKVFRPGSLLVGCVESFRMRDLLAHHFSPPRYRKSQSVEEYIFTDVLDAIRDTFTIGNFDLTGLVGDEYEESGAILLGFKGRLFCIDWDFHIGEVTDPFLSIGAGAHFALGSLDATRDLTDKYSPRLRVMNALRVAAHYCNTVRPPFRVISGK